MTTESDHLAQLKIGIDKFADIIKAYKHTNNIEIEIRIGILEQGTFRPGLNSEEFFNLIKNKLDSNPNWNSKDIIKTEECINNSIVQIGKNKTKKTKIYQANFSYENTPYDFRVSVSTECPTKERFNKINSIKRNKTRYSYLHSDYKFDLTLVLQEIAGVTETVYEFEIELLNITNEVSDVYRAHSALLKLRDIIDFCENISPESKITLISENILTNFENMKLS